MSKLLSIIIVTYNSDRLILDCLKSIYNYNDIGDSLEVIVVDNCSEDQKSVFNTIRIEFADKNIILIASPINGGYGYGNNQGVKVASSRYFVVMNPDVRLTKPIFSTILKKFTSNRNIGMLGVTFTDGSNYLYFKPEYVTLLKLIFSKFIIRFGFYNPHEMFFSGSFLVFDKLTFIKAGGFDERIFLYHEEADISNRILSLGMQTILAKDIPVLHLAHGREVNQFLLKVGCESRHYYFDKYKGDINKFYSNYLLIYKFKYLIAFLLNHNKKKDEFLAWMRICRNKGKVEIDFNNG